MHNRDIFEQFKSLAHDGTDNQEFTVLSLPGMLHKLGVSPEGYPKFFICTNDSISSVHNTSLEILTVEYNLPCTFVDDGVNEPHHYTVITLRSLEQTLQAEFIDIVLMMLGRLESMPSKREISIEVENLISIFSAMTCPPKKQIQGLWAELLVIERSRFPETIINAWHSEPNAKYDFTMGRDKVEVKSTSGEERKHHFSLDQLNPSRNSRLLIASIVVRESGHGNGGLSVSELRDKICERVTNIDCRMHLYQVMAETIGTDMHKLEGVFYDYIEASDTLRFYDAHDVPGIDRSQVGPGVSSVGFTSDLSGIIDIQDEESTFSCDDSPLFRSLF
jgi:hypothetical protein